MVPTQNRRTGPAHCRDDKLYHSGNPEGNNGALPPDDYAPRCSAAFGKLDGLGTSIV